MKKFVYYICGLLICLSTFASSAFAEVGDFSQILDESRNKETKERYAGGKVIVNTIFLPVQAEGESTTVTLYTHAGSTGWVRPIIKWVTPSDSSVSSTCASKVCDAARKTVTVSDNKDFSVYAVTYCNTSNTVAQKEVVAYTREYKICHSNDTYRGTKSHRLVAPAEATIRLVPSDIHVGNCIINGVQANKFRFKLPDGTWQDANYGKNNGDGDVNGDYPFDYAYATKAPLGGSTAKYECHAYKDNDSLCLLEEWMVETQTLPLLTYDTLYYNGFENYGVTVSSGADIVGFGKNEYTGEWMSDFGAYKKETRDRAFPLRSEYSLFKKEVVVSSHKIGANGNVGCSVYADVVSLPVRIFHFVVPNVNPSDKVFLSGWFRSRATTPDLCNLKFVVYAYDTDKKQKKQEIITYNTGDIPNFYSQCGVSFEIPAGCNALLVDVINNSFSQSGNNDMAFDDFSVVRLNDVPTEGIYRVKNIKNNLYLANDLTLKGKQSDGSTLWYVNPNLETGASSFLNLKKGSEVQYLSVDNVTVSCSPSVSYVNAFVKENSVQGDTVTLNFSVNENGLIGGESSLWLLEPVSLIPNTKDSSLSISSSESKLIVYPDEENNFSFNAKDDVSILGDLVSSFSATIEYDGSLYVSIFNLDKIGTYFYKLKNVAYSKGGLVPDEFVTSKTKSLLVTKGMKVGIYKIYNARTGRYLWNRGDSTSYKMQTDGTTLWYLTSEYDSDSEMKSYFLNLDTTAGKKEYLYMDQDGAIHFDGTKGSGQIVITSEDPVTNVFKFALKNGSYGFVDENGRLASVKNGGDEWVAVPASLIQYTNTYKIYYYASLGYGIIPIYRETPEVRIADPEKIEVNYTMPIDSKIKTTVKKSPAGMYIRLDGLSGYANLKYTLVNNAYQKGSEIPVSYLTSKMQHTIVSLNLSSGDWFSFRFLDDEKVFDVTLKNNQLTLDTDVFDEDRRETQTWQIEDLGANYFAFVNANGLVLTGYGDGLVLLKKYEAGNPSQRWKCVYSSDEDEVGYVLINEATGDALTQYGDNVVLKPYSSSYDRHQRLVASVSDYVYTVRIPQGKKGFDLKFQNLQNVNSLTIWSEDTIHGYRRKDFEYTTNLLTYKNTKEGLKEGTLFVDDQDFISRLSEGVYSFKVSVDSIGSTCENVYDLKLKVIPSKLRWTGADGKDATNWNNDRNWISVSGDSYEIPIMISSVEIPKNLSTYPILEDSLSYLASSNIPFRDQNFNWHPSLDTLYIEHGAEIARTDYLKYNYVKYTIDGLKTDRWYGMSTPLKDVYSGDFTFRNVNPLIYMREHDMRHPDDGIFDDLSGISWTSSFKKATEPLSNIGFAMKVGSLYYYGMTWSSDDAIEYESKGSISTMANLDDYGLDISLPKTNESFQFYNSITKKPTSTVQTLGVGGRDSIGRLLIEDGKGSILDESGLVYSFTIPDNVGPSDYILVPNPFLSHLDFSSFYEANQDFIGNEYKLLSGFEPEYDSYQYNNGLYQCSDGTSDAAYCNIAPFQSFIVVANSDCGGNQLKFYASMSVTDPKNPRLRSLIGSSGNQIVFVAKNQMDKTSALLSLDENFFPEYNEFEDSKRLFVEESQAPSIAIVQDDSYLDISREPKLRESIPLALMALKPGNVEVYVKGVMSLSDSVGDLYFVDKEASIVEQIKTDDYSYTFESKGATMLNRFFLMKKSAFSQSEDLVQEKGSTLHLYREGDNAVVISQNAPIRRVSVFFVNGSVYSVSDHLNVDVANVPLPIGQKIVLVTVTTDEETRTFKVPSGR